MSLGYNRGILLRARQLVASVRFHQRSIPALFGSLHGVSTLLGNITQSCSIDEATMILGYR